MFVTIEGLNGVGKTETVKGIRDRLGYHWAEVSPHFRYATEAMTWSEDVDARYLLFLSVVLHTSNRVAAALRCGKSVVVDGYVERTKAYHLGMGASVRIDIDQILEKPTLSILLVCDEKERQRRIVKRGRPRGMWDELADQHARSILRHYEQCGFPVVDTTDLSIEEVLREVTSILGRRSGGGS